MSTYLIGDVQGCYQQLIQLLEKINFDENNDHLGFAGDLVNRGPDSLKTLRFVKNQKNAFMVLGNHDLHLLTEAHGLIDLHTPFYDEIYAAPDKDDLLNWLRQQPLAYYDHDLNFAMTHAGIPPQWSIDDAVNYSNEVSHVLASDSYLDFLAVMFGDQPDHWCDDLAGVDRLRYIINALTRMRFCTQQGQLDLVNSTTELTTAEYRPWFEWRNDSIDLVFGHWAALRGKCDKPNIFAIDTGCVWGGQLTALRIEDKQLFHV